MLEGWLSVWEGRALLLQGLVITLQLTLIGGLGGFALAAVLALSSHYGPKPADWAVRGYVQLLRNIPLVLFLVFVHYAVVQPILGPSSFFASSSIAFILFEAAYVAEILRSGLSSIRQAEWEAAKSLGLSWWQIQRVVVLPLALRRAWPSLVNQWISLLKDTALASIIGLIELTRAGEILYERTHHDFEVLVVQAVLYFLLCSLMAWGLRRLIFRRQLA